MDLRDLECFVAIAESGSIAAASHRLSRVQSGISTRLKRLEEDLGVTLFERQGKRLALNQRGERFLVAARDLLVRAEQVRQLLQVQVPEGRFRLASMEATAAAYLPNLLSTYHRQFPSVQIELKVMPSWHSLAALEKGIVDAAFVSADVLPAAGVSTQQITSEQLLLVSASHQRSIRAPQDIQDVPLLVFPSGCAYRFRLERWAKRDHSLSTIEIGSYHALLGCAAAGMGVGLVPRSLLSAYPQRQCLRVHHLPAEFARDSTHLIWKGTGSANVNALLEHVRDHVLS